jgi:DNA-binding transcriptional LysR family regulator
MENLAAQPLIDYDATSEDWINWDNWFRRMGVAKPKLNYALRCTLYTDAVQAALHGQGITLGWRELIKDDLSAGRLIRIMETSIRPNEAYYAVIPHGSELTAIAQTLINWMRHEPDHPNSM